MIPYLIEINHSFRTEVLEKRESDNSGERLEWFHSAKCRCCQNLYDLSWKYLSQFGFVCMSGKNALVLPFYRRVKTLCGKHKGLFVLFFYTTLTRTCTWIDAKNHTHTSHECNWSCFTKSAFNISFFLFILALSFHSIILCL